MKYIEFVEENFEKINQMYNEKTKWSVIANSFEVEKISVKMLNDAFIEVKNRREDIIALQSIKKETVLEWELKKLKKCEILQSNNCPLKTIYGLNKLLKFHGVNIISSPVSDFEIIETYIKSGLSGCKKLFIDNDIKLRSLYYRLAKLSTSGKIVYSSKIKENREVIKKDDECISGNIYFSWPAINNHCDYKNYYVW